jgi:hypothetical protein
MWHGPAGQCIFVVCKHSDGRGGLDIYMSIHLFEIQMWFTCVFCVDVDDVDSIYELFMYV